MKQTAVDWLFEQLDEQVYRIDQRENRINISISFEDMQTIKMQAKQMEKKQLQDAFWEQAFPNDIAFEQYYKENYEQKIERI